MHILVFPIVLFFAGSIFGYILGWKKCEKINEKLLDEFLSGLNKELIQELKKNIEKDQKK